MLSGSLFHRVSRDGLCSRHFSWCASPGGSTGTIGTAGELRAAVSIRAGQRPSPRALIRQQFPGHLPRPHWVRNGRGNEKKRQEKERNVKRKRRKRRLRTKREAPGRDDSIAPADGPGTELTAVLLRPFLTCAQNLSAIPPNAHQHFGRRLQTGGIFAVRGQFPGTHRGPVKQAGFSD